MPVSSINRVKSIVVSLNEESENDIITIYENQGLEIGAELIAGYKIISFNAFIKNLKAYTKITSLNPVQLPNLLLEDSDTQKLYKVLDTEWNSPRKQLNLYISTNTSTWHPIGSISLLNPSGYPYRVYNLMDLFTDNLAIELGDNSRIGCQIQNVGHGLLTEEDSITIHGSYLEEIFVESKDTPININITGGFAETENPVLKTIDNSTFLSNSFLIGN